MRKPTRRKLESAGKPDKPLIDVWLQRSVWTVQILLLPLAIFGYIFTVRPVYQKQLLDEKIAERAVFYRKAMLDVEKLTAQQARIINENARLAADTKRLYSSLRANVLGALPSLAQNCGFDPKQTGDDLYACVTKAINEQVKPALDPSDAVKLEKVLLSHRGEIVSLAEHFDKQLREKSLQNQAEFASLDLKLKSMPQVFITKIQKMRGSPKSGARTIKDLGELRTDAEANAYLDFQDQFQKLLLKRHEITMDKLVLITSTTSHLSPDLRSVMEKVKAEMLK